MNRDEREHDRLKEEVANLKREIADLKLHLEDDEQNPSIEFARAIEEPYYISDNGGEGGKFIRLSVYKSLKEQHEKLLDAAIMWKKFMIHNGMQDWFSAGIPKGLVDAIDECEGKS